MMKYIFVLLFAFSLASFSCYREKTIDDEELESILHDIFVHNAYSKIEKLKLDSLNIYAPIFQKYGYTEHDLLRTLTIYTRRKSSRFGDVLDNVGDRLEREKSQLEDQIAVLDTVMNIADRKYGRLIYADSLIKLSEQADTAKLRIILAAEAGRYRISYKYKFDSLKRNFSIKADFRVRDTMHKTIADVDQWLNTSNVKPVNLNLTVEEGADSLTGVYFTFPKNQKFATLMIDSVRIWHYLPERVALDKLLRTYLNYELLIDSLQYDHIEKDSITLGINPPGLAPQSDDNSQ